MKTIDLRNETEDIEILMPERDYQMVQTTKEVHKIKIDTDPFDLVSKSWEEYVESHKDFLSEKAIKQTYQGFFLLTHNAKDAEAFIALAKLRLIWHEWVNMLGEPNYGGEEDYNYITWSCVHNSPVIAKSELKTYRSLAFIKYEHAEKFIECFGELLEQAKILL